ncbi:hypothetical protein P8452_07815 [Trifolium repens]|nr:hypothetical protein P8452_07815 [Trifolium repens]
MSDLLGLVSGKPDANSAKRTDEIDLQERSTKKKKEGDQSFSNQSSLPKDYSDAINLQAADTNKGSYRDKVMGEQFASLLEDIPEMDMENLDREDIINNRETEKENFMEGSLHMQNNYSTKGKNKRGNGRGCIKRIEGAERTPKETKLATRGTGAFKAKTGSQVKKDSTSTSRSLHSLLFLIIG